MKKIQIILSAVLVLTLFSCEREDENVLWQESTESIALPVVVSVDQTFFNLTDLDNAYGEFVLNANGDASEIEIQVNFNGGDFVTYRTISSFPSTITIPVSDMEDVLDLDRNDLVPGDSFYFTFLTTVGSKVFESSTTVNIQGACPSEIPDGEYTASQNDSGWFGSSTTKTVTITAQGGGSYLISDVSAGGYAFCCGAFGYSPDQPAIVTDVCEVITVTGTGGSQISSGQGSVSGSWDPDTETLTVVYTDTFNGSSDLTSTFVKQ